MKSFKKKKKKLFENPHAICYFLNLNSQFLSNSGQ